MPDDTNPETNADTAAGPPFDADWDAGDLGCGDLVLELRMRLRAMEPGQVIRVRTTDPGAPADLPAWCGMTGNPLEHAAAPYFWISRKPS